MTSTSHLTYASPGFPGVGGGAAHFSFPSASDLLCVLFRKKACKYFEQGKGTCPFGSKCLYRHAYPDGRLAEPEKPRKQLSSEGTVRVSWLGILWEFLGTDQAPNNFGSRVEGLTEVKHKLALESAAISTDPGVLVGCFLFPVL